MIPFPAGLKLIQDPEIGFCLVAEEYISEGNLLGKAFIPAPELYPPFHTLVLGGFLSHNENPNCTIQKMDDFWRLWSIQDLRENEIISIDYRLL